jgi:hypothetical protein
MAARREETKQLRRSIAILGYILRRCTASTALASTWQHQGFFGYASVGSLQAVGLDATKATLATPEVVLLLMKAFPLDRSRETESELHMFTRNWEHLLPLDLDGEQR